MKSSLLAFVFTVGLVSGVTAQDLMIFNFEDTIPAATVANTGSAPVGTNPAPVNGTAAVTAGTGASATQGLTGSGATGSFVDTGWAASVSGSWYLGFCLDMTVTAGNTNAFMYTSGDAGAGGWRTFTHGAAAFGNVIMRGPFTDVVITGGGSQTQKNHVLWVYDSSVPQIRGYLNGTLNVTVAQGAITLASTTAAAPFFGVGGYNGAAPPLLAGVHMDDFVLGTGVPSASLINALASACVAPTWQVNQPGSSALDFDGVQGSSSSGATPLTCVGSPGVVNSDGLAGLPWDVAVGTVPGVPLGSGALVTTNGQIVNQDITDPGLFFLNGLTFLSPYPGPFTIGYNFPAPADLAAQQVNIDGGQADGFGLSQHSRLSIVSQLTIAGPAVDDGFLQIFATNCGAPPSFTFNGVSYPSMFVNSNGSITFGAGDTNWTPTVALFGTGPARAGCWSDFSPNVGGTITTTLAGGTAVCQFNAVPEFTGLATGTFDMTLDAAGNFTISNYSHTGLSLATIVGMSPGTAATNPGPVTFSTLVGAGPQANAPTDMVYEFVPAGAPTSGGFGSILFMNGTSNWIVN